MFSFDDARLCITEAYSQYNLYFHKHDIQFTIQLENYYCFKLSVCHKTFLHALVLG